MNAWNNLKIGSKIFISITLVITPFVIALIIYHSNLNFVSNEFNDVIDHQIAAEIKAQEVELLMLQCRRHEKDFLLRYDMKYVGKLDKTIQSLKNEALKIKDLSESQLSLKHVDEIIHLANEYYTLFHKLVDLNVKNGLDHNSGLRGEFRGIVHNLAHQIEYFDVEEEFITLLNMRRYEKDYLRSSIENNQSNKKKYKQKVLEQIKTYKTLLDRSHQRQTDINVQKNALSQYESAFQELFQKETQDNYQRIRQAAHVLESSLERVYIHDATTVLLTIRKHEKDYMIRKLEKYVHKNLKTVDQLSQMIKQSNLVDNNKLSLRKLLSDYKVKFSEMVKADKEIDQVIASMRTTIHKIEPAVDKLVKTSMNSSISIRKQVKANRIKYTRIAIFCGSSALLIAYILAFFIIKLIVTPIKKTIEMASFVAGGDLTCKLDIDQQDEIGELSASLNKMVADLQSIIEVISGGVANLASSSTELATISQELSAGAEETSKKSENVSVSSEEMSANMNSISAAVEQASVNVETVATAAEEMNVTINDISEQSSKAKLKSESAVQISQDANKQVNTLGNAAKQIGSITETITEIAEQTNLLALNATIEAARAGESGKGFAVVANEIKELARQTGDATTEIKIQIDNIQNSIGNTVDQIEQISNVIKEVSDFVTEIAASIKEQTTATQEISQNISQASLGVREVASNVAQTVSVTRGIAEDITVVKDLSKECKTGTLQVKESSTSLSSLAEQLKNMVTKFKC